MVDTYSSTKNRVRSQTPGGNSNTWGANLNDNFERIDRAASGYLAKSITGNVTLTETESQYKHIKLTGTLSAAATVTIPGYAGEYIVTNATTGGYAVTVKTAAGTGISITNGSRRALFCDGTDTYVISSALQADQNLADLDDEAAARTNLGLGDLAVLDTIGADELASDSVVTAKILDKNVTLAKIADITTARILGRTTALSGVIEQISVSAAMSLTGGVLGLATDSNGPLMKAGGTMGGAITGSGASVTATGFKISDGTDIGALFISAVQLATSGSGNGVASISISTVNGVTTITQNLTTFATPGGGGGS